MPAAALGRLAGMTAYQGVRIADFSQGVAGPMAFRHRAAGTPPAR